MRNVEIEIFPIASSQPNDAEIRKWLNTVGASTYPWPQEDQNLTGSEAIIGLAAKRCYASFQVGLNPNVTKVRSDWTAYLDNILASGHGSVLEHASYSFAIEGVSRVFTAEMNRHRAGVAISEGSMRYIRLTDIPWWLPLSLRLTAPESAAVTELDILWENLEGNLTYADVVAKLPMGIQPDALTGYKKRETLRVFNEVFSFAEKHYTYLVELWNLDGDKTMPFHFKKQITSCLRRIIPIGVATGGVWTLNLRALRHVLAMRASEAAEEEICHVFSRVGHLIAQTEPRLFGDFELTPEGFWVPKNKKV